MTKRKKAVSHFLVNSANRPRICANRNQIRLNPGTIGRIRQKVACGFSRLFGRDFAEQQNFKRLKLTVQRASGDDIMCPDPEISSSSSHAWSHVILRTFCIFENRCLKNRFLKKLGETKIQHQGAVL